MKQTEYAYCAVIRTLGKAGDKYRQTLESLQRQSMPPRKILVYIAEGYDLPKETVGTERYIRCAKGMVTQRSQPFEEVDTDFALFLDDDVFIPEDGVRRLFEAVAEYGADCVAPEVYGLHEASRKTKLRSTLWDQTVPNRRAKWAFRVRRGSSYSYRTHPKLNAYPSQSGAGMACLCRMEAFRAVHLEDERWIDSFRYPLGEDQLLYFKLHQHGYRMMVHYASGIRHLDAGTGHSESAESVREAMMLNFIVWWRTQYAVAPSAAERLLHLLAFGGTCAAAISFRLLMALKKGNFSILSGFVEANLAGYRYVHSDRYRAYPSFDAHRKSLR